MIAALLAGLAIAQGGAEELWERYPLQPAPTPTAAQPPAPDGTPFPRDAERADADGGMGTFELVVLIALASTGGAAALRLAQHTSRRRDTTAPRATRAVGPPTRPAPPAAPTPQTDDRVPPPTENARTLEAPAVPGRATPRRGAPQRPAPTLSTKSKELPADDLASSDPQAARRFAPTSSEQRFESCRVRLWRGYVSRCYLAQIEGEETPVARSQTFRQSPGPEAIAALEALIDELRTEGWQPVLGPDGEWVGELRRPAATGAQR